MENKQDSSSSNNSDKTSLSENIQLNTGVSVPMTHQEALKDPIKHFLFHLNNLENSLPDLTKSVTGMSDSFSKIQDENVPEKVGDFLNIARMLLSVLQVMKGL